MTTDARTLHLDYGPVAIDTGYSGLFFNHVGIIVGYEAVFDLLRYPTLAQGYRESGHFEADRFGYLSYC